MSVSVRPSTISLGQFFSETTRSTQLSRIQFFLGPGTIFTKGTQGLRAGKDSATQNFLFMKATHRNLDANFSDHARGSQSQGKVCTVFSKDPQPFRSRKPFATTSQSADFLREVHTLPQTVTIINKFSFSYGNTFLACHR